MFSFKDIPVTFTGAGELASEEEIVSKDVAEFVTLLKDFKEKIVELRSRLAPSLERYVVFGVHNCLIDAHAFHLQ